MEPNQTPHEEPAGSDLLEDLAAITGLFNPEVIWHETEALDEPDEQPTPSGEEEQAVE